MQALDEGYVILSVIKFLLVDHPAVGKTSFKHLLFNWEPPRHRHNTAIADQPIRAVERVATLDGAKNLEMVITKQLIDVMLAEDICVQASLNTMEDKQHSLPSLTKKETPIVEKVKRKEALHPDVPSHSISPEPSLVISSEQSNTTSLEFYSKNNNEQNAKSTTINQSEDALPKESHHPSCRREDVVNEEDGSVRPLNDFGSVESDIVAPKLDKKDSILPLSKDILSAMKGATSRQLSQSTWIYLLDSGCQPQFADVSRAFVRGNAVNVIIHQLTDRLSSRLILLYSIDGKPLIFVFLLHRQQTREMCSA